MENEKILDILNHISIFSGMGNEQLQEIIPLLKPISCPTGTVIINEGSHGESMFIINSGGVKVTRSQGEDEEIVLQHLGAGSNFGEFSLIDNLPRSANVISVEDSDIFQLDKTDFDRLLAGNSRIAHTFYKNCLTETFSRFRNSIANYTFSQHSLREKSEQLEEINKDLSFAKKVQSYFINSSFQDKDDEIRERIRPSFIYHPCIEVGGDFFNIARIDSDHIGIIVADVEGHGVTAALATGILKSAFSILVKDLGKTPSQFVTRLNTHFFEVLSRRLFATCYYALINIRTWTLSTVKAGHYHPLFWKASEKRFHSIKSKGPGLGIIMDAEFEVTNHELKEGDKLLFFTDGILEQSNPEGDMYGQKRLEAKFHDFILSGEKNILECLKTDLFNYAGFTPITDDITMLLLEF
ncbi:MAG TPA: SpoIIE family protein phosphatase [Spirochaetota bacterium]|nr:SpoIIE family protein phosphatase [Spirochaetota bacterium]